MVVITEYNSDSEGEEEVQVQQKQATDVHGDQVIMGTDEFEGKLKNAMHLGSTATPAKEKDFSPADAYSGPRDGYAFKAGEQGLGYYKDAGARPSS